MSKLVVTSKIETLETLLRNLVNEVYNTLCASNSLEEGELVPENFDKVFSSLDAAYSEAKAYFEPIEAEKMERWANACATASYIMERLKESRLDSGSHPNMIDSGLHRNIADAINGSLIQTVEDREAGRRPTTMQDKLVELVNSGKLTEWKGRSTGH